MTQILKYSDWFRIFDPFFLKNSQANFPETDDSLSFWELKKNSSSLNWLN